MYFTHGILILDLSTYLAPLKLALNPTKKSKNKNYNSANICPIVKWTVELCYNDPTWHML